MLIFGPYAACLEAMQIKPQDGDVMFNFTSPVPDLQRIWELSPILDISNPNIDLMYAYQSYILSDFHVFGVFMNLMHYIYEGRNMYLCIHEEPLTTYLEAIHDLLPGFIQMRYGYNPVFINEGQDILSFDPGDYHFSVQGILTFDKDNEIYYSESMKNKIRNGEIHVEQQ